MATPAYLRYANTGATRNQALDPQLVDALGFLGDIGVTAEVFSGGQPGKGSGGARVGSTRHDHGGAGDFRFYKDGRQISWSNPDDLPIFKDIVGRAKAAGVSGIGGGAGYMGDGTLHLGFGSPGVWGAGGKSANAPDWLREAYGLAPMGEMRVASGGGSDTMQGNAGGDRLMSNNGGLGGLGGFQSPDYEPQKLGWRDLVSAIGDSLLTSNSDNPLGNTGLALSIREKELKGENKENKTLAFAEANFPDIAAMMKAGMSGQDAFTLMSRAKQQQELTADQRNFALAQQDPKFAAFLGKGEGNGALFDGKSVAAQGLNYLVQNGQLTPEQAASIAAGKTITNEDGQVLFATPQGIMAQQVGGGTPQPLVGTEAASAADNGLIPLTGPKSTVDDKKAMTFADRMITSGGIIDEVGTEGSGLVDRAASQVPIVGGYLTSEAFQKADQAKRDFINAQLRRESGAVIGADEFENANKQYFPQPGDTQAVLDQKKKNRQTVIDGMKRDGGAAYKPPETEAPTKRRKFNPATGTIE